MPRTRQRGRGRGRGHYGGSRQANAVMGFEESVQSYDEGDNDFTHNGASNEVNSEFTSYTLSFTIDSACSEPKLPYPPS